MTKRRTPLLALMLFALAGPAAAQPAQTQRRATLEAELLGRLVQRSAQELNLDTQARIRLQRFLENGEQQRRALARDGAELERRLERALQEPSTSDAEFDRILDGLAQIRQRELMLWRREHQMLRQFLTPRQHAQFEVLRGRFNQAVLDVRDRSPTP